MAAVTASYMSMSENDKVKYFLSFKILIFFLTDEFSIIGNMVESVPIVQLTILEIHLISDE